MDSDDGTTVLRHRQRLSPSYLGASSSQQTSYRSLNHTDASAEDCTRNYMPPNNSKFALAHDRLSFAKQYLRSHCPSVGFGDEFIDHELDIMTVDINNFHGPVQVLARLSNHDPDAAIALAGGHVHLTLSCSPQVRQRGIPVDINALRVRARLHSVAAILCAGAAISGIIWLVMHLVNWL